MIKKLLIIIMLVSLIPLAHAENDKPNSPAIAQYREQFKERVKDMDEEDKDEEREQRQLEHQERLGDICSRVDQRLEAKISLLEDNKEAHINRYNRVKDRLTQIATDMSELGLDVSKLEADLDTLDTMISDYTDAYMLALDLLQAAADIDCVNASAEFKEAMQAVRDQMTVVRTNRLEILEFYKEVLREDIKDLRVQAAEL